MARNQRSSAGGAKRETVGETIVRRLQEFTEVLRSGEPLEKHYTIRRVARFPRPSEYTAEAVRETRQLVGASQAVFAMLLGVSLSTVRAWEQGINPPQPVARRFMDEIRRDPDYWRRRLEEVAITA